MLWNKGDMTLEFLRKDGSKVGEEVAPTPPSMAGGTGRTFSTTAPAYTADESKNVTGFILRLPNVPEGTTGEVVAPSGVSYPIADRTATVPNEIAKYGTTNFTVRLTSGDSYGIYTLSIMSGCHNRPEKMQL